MGILEKADPMLTLALVFIGIAFALILVELF